MAITSKSIDFNKTDEEYEGITSYLKQIESDWERASEFGYELTSLAGLRKNDLRVCGTSILETKQLTTEGEIFVAFDAYSSIYETLGQVKRLLNDQLETDMDVIGMSLTDSNKQESTALFSKL